MASNCTEEPLKKYIQKQKELETLERRKTSWAKSCSWCRLILRIVTFILFCSLVAVFIDSSLSVWFASFCFVHSQKSYHQLFSHFSLSIFVLPTGNHSRPKRLGNQWNKMQKKKKMDLNSPSAEHGSIVNIKQVSKRRQRWVARTNGGLRFSRPGRSIVKQTADGASFVRLFDAFCC